MSIESLESDAQRRPPGVDVWSHEFRKGVSAFRNQNVGDFGQAYDWFTEQFNAADCSVGQGLLAAVRAVCDDMEHWADLTTETRWTRAFRVLWLHIELTDPESTAIPGSAWTEPLKGWEDNWTVNDRHIHQQLVKKLHPGWPEYVTRAAAEVGLTADWIAAAGAKKSRKRGKKKSAPGRKPKYDPVRDSKLLADWKAAKANNEYQAEFESARGLSTGEVKRAQARIRKRRNKRK